MDRVQGREAPSGDVRDGSELLARLNLVGSLIPDIDELQAYAQACDRQDAVGPLFYPDVHRRAAKRMRALRELALAGVKMRRAWEALQEAAAEEADPELDQAAATMLSGWQRRAAAAAREVDHG